MWNLLNCFAMHAGGADVGQAGPGAARGKVLPISQVAAICGLRPEEALPAAGSLLLCVKCRCLLFRRRQMLSICGAITIQERHLSLPYTSSALFMCVFVSAAASLVPRGGSSSQSGMRKGLARCSSFSKK